MMPRALEATCPQHLHCARQVLDPAIWLVVVRGAGWLLSDLDAVRSAVGWRRENRAIRGRRKEREALRSTGAKYSGKMR